MRKLAVLVLLAASIGCERQPDRAEASASTSVPRAQRAATDRPAFPIRIQQGRFVQASGEPFIWRGITAFRLAEMIAAGREREVAAYLEWAASQRLSVVRVLLMAQHLFQLTPERGRAALPRLLELAKSRGIAIEVVALADTRDVKLDYEAHLEDVGRVAMLGGNAFIEIANEPGHPTQDPRVHDSAFVKRLSGLLPPELLVALGSVEYGDGFAAGDYATTHVPRGESAWDHVLEVASRAGLARKYSKPVVSDEPIGAGPEYEPGRRDNQPRRFAAAAALTRLAGLLPTFHYDAGLQAKLPGETEMDCLAAWREGLETVDDASVDGEFLTATDLTAVATISGARASFGRVSQNRATVLLVDPAADASVSWLPGWREVRRSGPAGVLVIVAER
jgi:hypothetical protein